MPAFEVSTRIHASVERCFDESLSIEAHTSSMARSGEQAVAGTTSGRIGPGETVTWRARHFGVRFRMTSRISQFEPPRRFVDEQVSGPFRSWWHEHVFEADGDSTRMIDRVEFSAPFGILGRIAERLFLERYMRRLILQRNAWLKRELESRG